MRTTLVHKHYRLIRIDPGLVDESLPAIRPILERSVSYTRNFETVDQMIATMRQGARPWQLWLMLDVNTPAGAFITTLERHGPELVMTFEVIAGVDAQEWIAPMIHNFEQYMAQMYGVTQTQAVGRKGWERFLKGLGYEPLHFVTGKKLCTAITEALCNTG